MRSSWAWAVVSGGLAIGCGGSVYDDTGARAGAGPSVAGAASSAAGAGNGATTPELRATGIPLLSVMGELDAPSQRALCQAVGAWRFRLKDPICDAFVESAVVLMPHTTEEARRLCAENRTICRAPTEPTAACSSVSAACTMTLAELDQCIVDTERWYQDVPSCETMTLDRSYPVGPTLASCSELYSSACQPIF